MFTFNGTTAASMGLGISAVRRPLMPDVKRNVQEVAGMHGSYLMQTAVGDRRIEFDVYFEGTSLADAVTGARALAAWLYSTEPLELTLSDESGVVYYAQLDGATNLEAITAFRSGTLVFVCSDPFAYATSATTTAITDGANTVANAGGLESYPVIDVTIATASTTFVEVANETTGEYVRVGMPAEGSDTPSEPIVLDWHDDCSVMDWTEREVCEGGEANLSTDPVNPMVMDTGGASFSPFLESGNDGTGTGWHGPTVSRALSAPLTDFKVEALIYLDNTDAVGQMGRIELYLLDASLNVIGKMGVIDAWNSMAQVKFYAAAGPAGAHYITNGLPSQVRGWNDLLPGKIAISRVQTGASSFKWSCYIGKKLADGTYGWQQTKSWVDAAGAYGADLAHVAIHVGAYGSATVPTRAEVSEVWVSEFGDTGFSQLTYIGRVGDVFRFDMRQGVVLLDQGGVGSFGTESRALDDYGNPMPVSALVHYTSTFWPLPVGDSTVSVLVDDAASATGTAYVIKRWL